MKLYEYQEKAVNHAIGMLHEQGNSLIVAGTGAGKTICMSAAIGKFTDGFTASYGKKPHVLVLVHRAEIHTQNHSKFSLVCPAIQTSEITATKKSLKGNVHFGMVQTVVGLLKEFEAAGSFFDLVVVDEAHHSAAATYEEIISWNKKGNPNARLLGVTATPNRGDELPLVHLFDNFYQITTKYLIDGHYLVRPRFVDLSPKFEITQGKKTKTEYGFISKNCKGGLSELIELLCDEYLKEKEDGKSIIFAPHHGFCETIYSVLKSKGRNPAYLHKNISREDRLSELARFETGDAEELINVDIATEGYDFPPLRNIVDFDTNGTHSQWVQKVGRVLRTAHNKTTCTVIDFGGNIRLYPDGIETTANLEGKFKVPAGERLKSDDFFVSEKSATCDLSEKSEHTPYNPPKGFETVSDKDFRTAFVCCGEKGDGIIVSDAGRYSAFVGDKKAMRISLTGTFDECVRRISERIGEPADDGKPISKTQIKLIAPEYSAMALTRYGANCVICWKVWKSSIEKARD